MASGGNALETTTVDGGAAKGGSRKLMAIAAAAVLALGGGGAYFAGLFGGDEPAVAEGGGGNERMGARPIFHPLPEMIVTINTGERKSTFLKVRLNLEIGDAADAAKIEALMPRVTDACTVFLRDLRPDDLQGSAGTARLRSELLRRIGLALAPIAVKDVLIAEMMIN